MAYKVEFEAETVRFKVLFTTPGDIDKVKLNIKNSMVLKEDLINGLNFLKHMGIDINRNHKDRLTYEELINYQGTVGEIEPVKGVNLVLVDDAHREWISVSHAGIYDDEAIKRNTVNLMVDLVVALYGLYNNAENGIQ